MADAIYKINQYLAQRIPGSKLDINGAIGIQQEDLSVISIVVDKNSEICHLSARITTLSESDKDMMNYYLNVCDILFGHYDTQQRIATGDNSSQN